jgi:hypothetical protein
VKDSPPESLDYEALEAYLHAVFSVLEGRSESVRARRAVLAYLKRRKEQGLSEELEAFLLEFFRARFGEDAAGE